MASPYGNQVEYERICISLQNKLDLLFNSFNNQLTELSSSIQELEQFMLKDVTTAFEKIKPKSKYSTLNQNQFELVLNRLIKHLSIELSVPAHIRIDEIYAYSSLFDDLYFLIENLFKYLYLKFELLELEFLLKARNRILFLQVSAISDPLRRTSVSDREHILKDRIYSKIDDLNTSIIEEDSFDDSVIYKIPLT